MSAKRAAAHKESSGVPVLYLGMLLFLLSETFLFGNLFFTYFYLRAATPVWPPQGAALDLPLTIVNTVILLASSVTMQMAINRSQRNDRNGMVSAMLITAGLGFVFLVIKGWDWITMPFRPWDHAYGSVFFTTTGFHGLHVLAGIILILALVIRARRSPHTGAHPGPTNVGAGLNLSIPVETAGLYWHFVDLVWIFVFTSLYIIR